jgi:hypothetical protein
MNLGFSALPVDYSMLFSLFLFLVLFQIKHWLADYPLQTEYMLGKFKDTGWVRAAGLSTPAVHALGTILLAALWGANHILLLGLLDFVVHFTMDRIKASPYKLGRFKPLFGDDFLRAKADSVLMPLYENEDRIGRAKRALKGNTYFWWFLGIDQGVHHLTHYAVLLLMILGA